MCWWKAVWVGGRETCVQTSLAGWPQAPSLSATIVCTYKIGTFTPSLPASQKGVA